MMQTYHKPAFNNIINLFGYPKIKHVILLSQEMWMSWSPNIYLHIYEFFILLE